MPTITGPELEYLKSILLPSPDVGIPSLEAVKMLGLLPHVPTLAELTAAGPPGPQDMPGPSLLESTYGFGPEEATKLREAGPEGLIGLQAGGPTSPYADLYPQISPAQLESNAFEQYLMGSGYITHLSQEQLVAMGFPAHGKSSEGADVPTYIAKMGPDAMRSFILNTQPAAFNVRKPEWWNSGPLGTLIGLLPVLGPIAGMASNIEKGSIPGAVGNALALLATGVGGINIPAVGGLAGAGGAAIGSAAPAIGAGLNVAGNVLGGNYLGAGLGAISGLSGLAGSLGSPDYSAMSGAEMAAMTPESGGLGAGLGGAGTTPIESFAGGAVPVPHNIFGLSPGELNALPAAATMGFTGGATPQATQSFGQATLDALKRRFTTPGGLLETTGDLGTAMDLLSSLGAGQTTQPGGVQMAGLPAGREAGWFPTMPAQQPGTDLSALLGLMTMAGPAEPGTTRRPEGAPATPEAILAGAGLPGQPQRQPAAPALGFEERQPFPLDYLSLFGFPPFLKPA